MSVSILQRLGIAFQVDHSQLRDASATMLVETNKLAGSLGTVSKQFETLGKGTGERFYSQGVQGAIGLASAQNKLGDAYEMSYQATLDYATSLRTVALQYGVNQTSALALSKEQIRVAASNEVVARSAATTTSRLIAANNSISAVGFALTRLDLVNYSLSHHMENANWVQVLFRGPGKVVHGLEILKQSLFGVIPALHAVQKVIHGIAAPALFTLATRMFQMSGNPWATMLGKGLATLGRDFLTFGSTGRTMLRMVYDGIFSLWGGFNLAAKGFDLVTQKAQAAGRAFRESGGWLGNLGASAMKAVAFLSQLGQAAVRVTQGFFQFLKYVALIRTALEVYLFKAVWKVTTAIFSLGKAAINTGPLGALKNALVGTGNAANKAAADMIGLNKSGQAASMGLMTILGPAAMFGAVGGAIFGAFTGLKHGVEWANQTEQITKSFETMLPPGEKAEDLLHRIKDFGKTTPFLIPNLNDAARDLTAYGVSAAQVVPTLKVLGDVSGGNEERFKELVEVYGKLKASGGSLQLDQINQIASRGIPIFQELKNVLGAGDGELRNMVTNGLVQLPHLQQALKNLTSEGGMFKDGLTNQTDTVIGQFGRLKENLGLLFQDFAQAGMKAFDVKGMIGGLTAIVGWVRSSFVPMMLGGFTIVADYVKVVVGWIVSTWTTFAPYIMTVWGAVWTFVTSVASSAWTAITTIFQAGWTFLTSLFGGDSMGIGGWTELIQASLLAVSFAFINWKEYVALAATNAMYYVVRFGNQVAWVFTDVIPTYLVWFGDQWINIFKTIASFTTSVFKGLWENAKNFFTGLWNWVSSKGSEPFEFTWTGLTDSFKNSIADLPNVVVRSEGEIEKTLRQQAEGMQTRINSDFQEFVEGKIQKIDAAKKPVDVAAAKIPGADLKLPEFQVDPLMDINKKGKQEAKDKEDNKAALFGSSDALQSIAKLKTGDDLGKDKQVKEQKTTNSLLREQTNAIKALSTLTPAKI